MTKKTKKPIKSTPTHTTTGNVFSDLGFDHSEAIGLKMKSDLLIAIQNIVQKRGHKSRDLEKLFDQPQSRVSELMTGKISKMSIERLLGYLERLGGHSSVKISFRKAA